jgi:hypothetical protein
MEPELEPQFVISAPAPGGNLISAPRLWLRLCNTEHQTEKFSAKGCSSNIGM